MEKALTKEVNRYFLWISYKGTPYAGWQKQPHGNTVQNYIEKALAQVCQKVKTYGSSRTDQGVHATANVAHVDLHSPPGKTIDCQQLRRNLNGVLPRTICIRAIHAVPRHIHARHSAIGRSYRYHISACRNPFTLDTAYYLRTPLDIAQLNAAASLLIGEQDFTSFCKKKANVTHHYCNITEAKWEKTAYGYAFIISANRFLHGMVRSLAGTLLQIGLHQYPLANLTKILRAKDRCLAGPAVPAHGLFLTKVTYPPTLSTPHLGSNAYTLGLI